MELVYALKSKVWQVRFSDSFDGLLDTPQEEQFVYKVSAETVVKTLEDDLKDEPLRTRAIVVYQALAAKQVSYAISHMIDVAIAQGAKTTHEVLRAVFGSIEHIISDLSIVKDLFEDKAKIAFNKKRRP